MLNCELAVECTGSHHGSLMCVEATGKKAYINMLKKDQPSAYLTLYISGSKFVGFAALSISMPQ